MNKQIAKKTIIVHILILLYNGSSFESPIKINQITNVLNSMGILCDRRTVSRNIKYLIEAKLPIFRKKGNMGGYYYNKELDKFFN